MYNVTSHTANDGWISWMILLKNDGHSTEQYKDSSTKDQDTKEILHTKYTILDPRQRLVFEYPLNPAFLAVEIVWILNGRKDVEFLEFWNPRMKTWSDDGVKFHGAYGDRLGLNEPAYRNQMKRLMWAMKKNPQTRHGVLQIWDKKKDLPTTDGTPQSKDIPCNIASILRVHEDKLHWMQTQRSQDVVWGLPTNIWQWTMLQEVMAGWIDKDLGYFTYDVSSLHIYERHWNLLYEVWKKHTYFMKNDVMENPAPKELAFEYAPINTVDLRMSFGEFAMMLPVLTNSIQEMANRTDIYQIEKTLGEYYIDHEGWRNIQKLCCVEAMRRTNPLYETHAVKMAESELNDFLRISWLNYVEAQNTTKKTV